VGVITYRKGLRINVHRKDFIVTVAPCDFAGAQLNPSYTSCDGFTLTFNNLNSSPLNISFYWDFGDGTSSTDAEPVHTYRDTGVYKMMLVVNRGSSCADSATSLVRVFPGYFPDFASTAPTCKGVPVQFSDQTRANYGVTNDWKWDFGLVNSSSDTSRLKNPTFAYPAAGTYNVILIVSSNKGCIDTFPRQIDIVDKAPFSVTNDTLICSADNLQLTATATNPGIVTWSPNYNINDIHSFTPLVSPKINTTYHVNFSDKYGCSASDSVVVKVVNFVSLSARSDTAICRTDSIRLTTFSDALMYTWTPSATLSSTTVQSPLAIPVADTTRYHVIGRIGSCTKEDDVVIRTSPYPTANAGKDTSVCYGFNASLHASGGSVYSWSPAFFLNSTSIANPVSQNPTTSIRYIVTVSDNKGCPKPVNDTVLVNVTHIIANAGPRDTSVVLTQPLQLQATGGTNYQWTPSTWLTDPSIANPVSLPLENITYALRVSDAQGCFGLDTINVHVFKTTPMLFVPSAFTPNGDVLNDVFKPIAAGIRSLESFRVYNRWGQLMYSTTELGKGWDGRFGGNLQGTATYVWYAEATDYLGKKIFKKGSVVLIR
jgi:gliding motility-associated-like protein